MLIIVVRSKTKKFVPKQATVQCAKRIPVRRSLHKDEYRTALNSHQATKWLKVPLNSVPTNI